MPDNQHTNSSNPLPNETYYRRSAVVSPQAQPSTPHRVIQWISRRIILQAGNCDALLGYSNSSELSMTAICVCLQCTLMRCLRMPSLTADGFGSYPTIRHSINFAGESTTTRQIFSSTTAHIGVNIMPPLVPPSPHESSPHQTQLDMQSICSPSEPES
jgi:hypothetical protein